MTESRKKIVREKPPETLLWELRVDLDTELTVDECIRRLENANKTSPLTTWLLPVRIDIIVADANGIEFDMHFGSGYVTAWMLGHLSEGSNGLTLFQGTVGIAPSIVYLFGLLLLIPIGVLVLTGAFGALLLGILITTIGIAFLYYSAKGMRYDLIDKLETLLLE